MRTVATLWCALLFSLAVAGSGRASEGFEDLVKVVKAGSDDALLTAYINNAKTAFNLSVDEIIFLNDLGLPSKTITAIIQHDKNLAGAPAEAPPEVAKAVETLTQEDPGIPASAANDTPVTPGDQDTPEPIAAAPEAPEAPEAVGAPTDDENVAVEETPVEAPQVTAPAPEDANLTYFYNALSPYGQWVSVDGNWVWRPSCALVDTSWRPYCHRGHWVYTDGGWAWNSDYSWGWAPFHYGRWTQHRRYGWIWRPDTVWGPAWVAWRQSETHCGWAPLPFDARYEAGVGFHFGNRHISVDFNFGLGERDYTFIPIRSFGQDRVIDFIEPRSRITIVYRQTTVISNTYINQGDVIINRGIAVDRVSRVSGREFRPVRIVDVYTKPGERVGRNAVRDNALNVYRPRLKPVATVTPRVITAQRQAAAERKREELHKDSAFGGARNGANTGGAGAWGRSNREAPAAKPGTANRSAPGAFDPALKGRAAPQKPTAAEQRQAEAALARQRQAEETAARKQASEQRAAEESRQRAAADAQRKAQETRKAEEERQRGLEIARRKAEEAQKARAEQERAQEAKRQADAAERQRQEAKRQAEQAAERQRQQAAAAAAQERARQQQVQAELARQRQAEEAAARKRQAEAAAAARQRQQAEEAAARERRAEEAAARQRAAAQERAASAFGGGATRQQPRAPAQQPSNNAFNGGNSQVTDEASKRGANSRKR